MRREHDLLGELDIPENAYYGIQTFRSTENFRITGLKLYDFPDFIKGLAFTKQAAAQANYELGYLDEKLYKAMVQACKEVADGKFDKEFVVDMIQGGAGTSTNMNANEVIANRANEILGQPKGVYNPCHPNNHVNLAQSTNDAYPTAAKLGICLNTKPLIEELKQLISAFRKKAEELGDNIKMGRTQLQDAVPMTLGQEFESYAASLEDEIAQIEFAEKNLHTINMGATAIGTGINSDPKYTPKVTEALAKISGFDLTAAKNMIAATNDTSGFVTYSSQLKRLCAKLSKICSDLRLLSSGPRTGIYDISLPAMQPGSSIMPGKVNPVIPEVVNQVCYRVIGNDTAVVLAAESGQLELNVFEPVMIYSVFESIKLLINAMKTLRERCVTGIVGNYAHCKESVLRSIGLVTALNPVIGYEASSDIAKTALRDNRSVYDLVLERKLLSKEKLDDVLKPENMTKPRKLK